MSTGTPRVAIVSDGSALPAGTDLISTLREVAALISGLARVAARPRAVLSADATGLIAAIRALPPDTGAVLLTRVTPERARQVRRELRDSDPRPLLTDEDVTTIALASATSDALPTTWRRRAHGARVVIAGAREMPGLTALLMASGIADITTWNLADAVVFPLHNIVFGADAVVDLVGALSPDLAGISVITREDAGKALYAASGLLRAAACASGLGFDVEVFRACARALSAAPPAGRSMPFVKGIALTRLVADAATSVFQNQLSR
ncbi:hypothetical protein [Amycolatopsis sp. NPDC059657]|uniref:hypothetical protein n=1 Tax=Amycolatopsis sp. NPDC059657 TaxID=3346899 RepID=UPI00366D0CB6